MIRINLLPVRAEKKKESKRQQLSIAILIVILSISAMAFLQISINRSIDAKKKQLSQIESEINKYKSLLKEVSQYKAQKKMIAGKIDVIKKLDRNRWEHLYLLDRLSSVIPENAWLDSLKERKGAVEIKGIAADNNTIANFMRNLEGTKWVDNVELLVTRKTSKFGRELKSFTINFKLKVE